MRQPLVSIVVCTYNRASCLDRCLQSLLKQTYGHCEIIVINGLSTDRTDAVLAGYQGIRTVRQGKMRGLSYARNLGIVSSRGEIVAFIDDDAVADPDWLRYLVGAYEDDTVGGTGGYVYDPWGNVQFDNGIIEKNGRPEAVRPSGLASVPGQYRICMGTNCSFRRAVLDEIGGFDHYFRYYHDESELCVRIAQKGYRIIYVHEAVVLHEMAEGPNRRSSYDLEWAEIMKNIVYFTMKSFPSERASYASRPVSALRWRLSVMNDAFFKKQISVGMLLRFYAQHLRGFAKGYYDGLFRRDYSDHIAAVAPEADRLRVCLTSSEYRKDCTGGVCRYTYDLAHELARRGHEVHVLTASGTADTRDGDVYVHTVRPANVDFLSLPDDMPVTKKNLAYSYALALKLDDLVREYGLDLVEFPLWDAEGFVYALDPGIPVCVRLQTPLYKVVEIEGRRMTDDLSFADFMEGEALRRSGRTIAISVGIGGLIGSHHGVPADHISLCRLGIPVPGERLIRRDRARKGLKVLFVGRLEARKGIVTLIDAIPGVLGAVGNVQFQVVGSDTSTSPTGGSFREYLEQRIDPRYQHHVEFSGFVGEDRLAGYYRDCDLFVAPSLYESFGIIYLEAMAWGKPVIGCCVGGVPEIVDDGNTGILVLPNDPVALATAITKILTDDALRERMGTEARRWVETRFSSGAMAENTIAIYRDMLSVSRGSNGHGQKRN